VYSVDRARQNLAVLVLRHRRLENPNWCSLLATLWNWLWLLFHIAGNPVGKRLTVDVQRMHMCCCCRMLDLERQACAHIGASESSGRLIMLRGAFPSA
jgi:hypothetical protein